MPIIRPILPLRYEVAVRTKLGLEEDELADDEINQPLVADFAEAAVMRKVPNYAGIVDAVELMYLQHAAVSYICFLLCPSMARKLNVEVASMDTKWKKGKVDWDAMAAKFLSDYEMSLNQIQSARAAQSTGILFSRVRQARSPIGGGTQ